MTSSDEAKVGGTGLCTLGHVGPRDREEQSCFSWFQDKTSGVWTQPPPLLIRACSSLSHSFLARQGSRDGLFISWLHSSFETLLGYTGHCLQNKWDLLAHLYVLLAYSSATVLPPIQEHPSILFFAYFCLSICTHMFKCTYVRRPKEGVRPLWAWVTPGLLYEFGHLAQMIAQQIFFFYYFL